VVLPGLTPSLRDEIAHMGWNLEPLEPGYARILGAMYTTYVAFTNEIAETEDDDYLRVFSDHALHTAETTFWLEHWMMEKETMLDPKQVKPEGYDEMMQKLLDRLAPEERLRGLDDEQTLLALPASVLRHLSEDYLRSLSPAVQQVVRERIARGR
jgi:hypothetical protein